MSVDDALRQADALLRKGDFPNAERTLITALNAAPRDPRLHMARADLLTRAGFAEPAMDALRTVLQINPNDHAARNRLARVALQANRFAEAEQAARQLIALAPSADAWDILSCALRSQDKFEDSIAASDKALALEPNSTPAIHNKAVTLAKLGRNAEALVSYDALVARGVSAGALWLNRGVALLNDTRAEEAEAQFADGVKRWPFDVGLQNALANVRWMRGAGEMFTRDYEAAIAQRPDAIPLVLGCADLLRRAGFGERAEALLRKSLAQRPDDAALLVSLGVMLDERDRTAEALPHLQRAVVLSQGFPSMRANLTAALLRLGRGDEALREIQPVRKAEPLNQEWICYETMALRQLGDPRYHELCDYDLMVRPYDLAPPNGFATMDAFNEALSASLNKLHVLETHPLDQSLRNGSQTTRSLLYVDDPVIQAYLKALDEPIRAYQALMQKPDHPWSGRKTGRHKLAGAWSVKLKANGYHINHLHPAGWISSAYYVSLPKAVEDAATQQGWIKFGEARWPTPGITTEKVVQPKVGRLVLFPSYMWHGTIPFSEGERLTAPFDVLPD